MSAEANLTFFIQGYFYLKEQLQIKLQLSKYLAHVFSKENEVSLSLQGKQMPVFVAYGKSVKIRILKNLCLLP